MGIAPPTKMSASGKPAALSRRADGFRDRRRRARRVAGLDLDHLLVDLARELSLGFRRHRGRAALRVHTDRAEQQE